MKQRGLVAIPTFNEAPALVKFLPKLLTVIEKLPNTQTDVVVIDDGSTDNSAGIAQDNGCQVISHARNMGLGASLCDGYKKAVEGDYGWLATMDSDGQHDPNLLPTTIQHLKEVDLVLASRYHPQSKQLGTPLDRALLNVGIASMIHSVTGWQHITDPLTGFWTMNQRIAQFLAENITFQRYGSCLEALIKLWYLCQPKPQIIEVPHPAIYTNNSGALKRVYSHENQEIRIERAGTHTLHIIQALEGVAEALNGQIDFNTIIKSWHDSHVT